jgi:hypothetical protein
MLFIYQEVKLEKKNPSDGSIVLIHIIHYSQDRNPIHTQIYMMKYEKLKCVYLC